MQEDKEKEAIWVISDSQNTIVLTNILHKTKKTSLSKKSKKIQMSFKKIKTTAIMKNAINLMKPAVLLAPAH